MKLTYLLNSAAFSPQADSTDRATAACPRSYCQLLRIDGVAWSAQRIPTGVTLGFLDRAMCMRKKEMRIKFSCGTVIFKNQL
jgi:hypothetical protein